MFVLFVFLLIVAVVLFAFSAFAKSGGGDSELSEKHAPILKWCGIGSVVFGGLFLFLSTIYVVQPGNVGVEVLFGKIQKYSENGMRFKNPLASVLNFDIRTIRQDFTLECMSRDMQLVKIEAIINYRIDYTRIESLYTKVGVDYLNKIVVPAVAQTLKAVCSQYKVEDVTVNRDAMKDRAQIELMSRLSNYYIILQDISLADIDFSEEFNKVVEEKQLEEQKIKTAEYRKKQAEQDKQTTILQAQAEAEKQRLLRATTSKEVIELKRIEKWDGHYPTVLGGNNLLSIKLPE